MMRLQVRVKPNAKQSKIQPADDGIWIVHLQAPPVDGKANQALIKLLSKHFGVARSCIRIKAGATGRQKLVEIDADC